ncbi:MAG: hypothetical protein K8R34_02025 [Methanosarcinales archaeon]|nr:hypothetical protein [Methanosarcinales archaeon]
MMPVTPNYDPGTYGPDKDGVDGGFGSFTEAAEMNRVPHKKLSVIHRQRNVGA